MRITIEIDERTLGVTGAAPEVVATIGAVTSPAAGTAQDGGSAPRAPGSAGVDSPPPAPAAETGANLDGVSAGAAPTVDS